MSNRQSGGAAESTGSGWFVVALSGLAGIATGLVLGFALWPSGRSVAELTAQRDRISAENAALTAERDWLRGANAALTAEKNGTEHLLDQTKLQAQGERASESSDPQTTRWRAGREIAEAYGPSSAFGGFAHVSRRRSGGAPGTYWSLRGNVELAPEATGLQLEEPVAKMSVGRLSWFQVKGEAATATFELDLEQLWANGVLMGDKSGSTLQGACEAVGRAMEFDDQEIRRIRKVAGLIPRVPPGGVPKEWLLSSTAFP